MYSEEPRQKIINVVINEGEPKRKISPALFIGIALFLLALAGACNGIAAIGEALR